MFHQGWTDIILCIGLIWYNLDNYKNVVLIIRNDSEKLIGFIFRNIKNIHIDFIDKKLLDNIHYRNNVFDTYTKHGYDINLYGGSINQKVIPISSNGDKYYFYKTYNIDENLSIQNFIIERDYELEDTTYKQLINEIGDKYVIIFDDKNRKLSINRSKIVNKEIPQFNLCESSKICFDLIKILENSQEIHILSTFWSLIIYQLQKKYGLFKNIPIYFHESVRPGYYNSLYENNNWLIV
jgi:hypothetical protein